MAQSSTQGVLAGRAHHGEVVRIVRHGAKNAPQAVAYVPKSQDAGAMEEHGTDFSARDVVAFGAQTGDLSDAEKALADGFRPLAAPEMDGIILQERPDRQIGVIVPAAQGNFSVKGDGHGVKRQHAPVPGRIHQTMEGKNFFQKGRVRA